MNVHPILPGFFPDPSICRVGNDHYLIASSFEYFPGVPIFHSRDLTAWEQIGNVLDRPSQLPVATGLDGASTGIYAPTLRHHDGSFWMITTNRTTMDELRKGHLIVRAEDPSGPWSDPVHTTGAIGIDPDLAWDDDGTCYMTWSMLGIMQAPIDPVTGKLLGEPRKLWDGTGLAHPEGPHLFRRGAWWYLVIAEGGTGPGHGVTVARSRSITGPFEAHPANPILSHRSTDHPVQNTGHADLVELADGRWAMVHLGVRPRGAHPKWHVNGRETFLTGIAWADDWPVVDEDAFGVPAQDTSFTDDFIGGALHPRWISPGTDPRGFTTPSEAAPGGLVLRAGRAHDEREARHLLAVRARDEAWQATAALPAGDAALVVRVDDAHWAAVERRGTTISVRMVVGPLDRILATAEDVPADRPLAVRCAAVPADFGLRTAPDRLQLGYADGGFRPLADVDGRYLSTEVAGGFTGRVIGVEALDGDAVLTRFTYQAEPTTD
ncbi:glycoside hydrolase family 43 protein [Yinghuangia sp. ASG 101]|uniref:glycoside hydrolase family 43 protein n=1 Tax=Yinghuangia sp. ASG 101 TaxID=2896848 RepID=UPI001E4CD612|nr:glycoside hydrolase family 43 protein [Yinghuangia sp. ASG 101]UGQ11749.1 glycoside hydrolase family 43 protein [Yinghuangia sp. ASG 101]